ncbi:MAG: hypothetical protein GC152_14145 [Alphaproteobacteria bacterium]|nr:hypothetical protein [Alphaproteobacteria bacterium]
MRAAALRRQAPQGLFRLRSKAYTPPLSRRVAAFRTRRRAPLTRRRRRRPRRRQRPQTERRRPPWHAASKSTKARRKYCSRGRNPAR